ncbi:serine protease inhibitor ecotin [Bacteroides sp. 224]|uniref:serine protease inhibitor ecotin n=1 Tax=Bacteroides sp. 224 TaxID=2302936 RepID=UPI0013D7AB72|nr:serine protease inhibitor ecotin [Bacteroides sp. 224]NDV64282.1 ecotin [Bacteroides sp. 224]
MKKHFSRIMLVTTLLVAFTGIANAQNMKVKEEREKMLAPYPQAKEGMVRYVIFLKEKANEENFKVEIVPGKVMNVDCNHHTLMGKIEAKDVQGWGYTYYEFTSNGQTRSTMMACNKPKEDRFISGESKLIRYNSKLPIVLYAPAGYELKYKIWKVAKTHTATNE